jgi:iron uptake system EfeUOB component EfeO/EfeM
MSRLALLFAPLAVAVALAGCADHSGTTERNGTVSLTLKEFRISPQNVSAQTGAITFVVRNDGILAHDFRVKQGKHVLGGTTTIAPGATQRKTMHLQQGHYRIFSSLRRDEALGQYGKLTVH